MSKSEYGKVTPLCDRAAVKEEAGAWIVRIDRGELAAREIADLQAWLARGSFHRDYLEKLARNWDETAVLQELADIFPLDAGEPAAPESERSRGFWSPAWAGLGATAAAALLLLVFMRPGLDSASDTDRYLTRIGERAEWQLPDSSHMHVNTDSRIEIDFSGEWRLIKPKLLSMATLGNLFTRYLSRHC